jgi:thiol-disulfide isomerase/thioredoxin
MNSADASRRRTLWVVLATAAVAAATGAGTAWWRLTASQPDSSAADALFAATFVDPDDLPQALSQWQGRLLVVNFWATWCAPCVEEMPDLQKVRDEYVGRGVEIIGIGIDNIRKIRDFRDQHQLSLPLLVAGAGGSELGRTLGNVAGALPYTVLVSRDGRIVQRKLGQIKPTELRRWLDAQL